jgi:drug/metabolite transporter (DMT)-like permease
MSWLFFAFAAPVLYAVSTHLDKYLVERYFKNINPAVLLIPSAIVFTLPIIWFFHPGVLIVSLKYAAVLAISGLLFNIGLLFYLRALQGEDASTVSPLFQTIPLFSFAFGFFLLGETLSQTQIIGGLLILLGSLLLSIQFTSGGRRLRSRMVLLMLGAAISISLSVVLFKLFAVTEDFWSGIFWSSIGEVFFGVILLAQTSYRQQYLSFFTKPKRMILALGTINEIINIIGVWCVRYAILLAPLALVQVVTSTTPGFVFLFGVLLTLFFPHIAEEKLSRGHVIQKTIAIFFIIGGTIFITLHT